MSRSKATTKVTKCFHKVKLNCISKKKKKEKKDTGGYTTLQPPFQSSTIPQFPHTSRRLWTVSLRQGKCTFFRFEFCTSTAALHMTFKKVVVTEGEKRHSRNVCIYSHLSSPLHLSDIFVSKQHLGRGEVNFNQ